MQQSGQTWNNILNYIKRNLGIPVNLLEMSDEEIIQGLKEDTIPYFSQFCPQKKNVIIDNRHLETRAGYDRYRYKIPMEVNEYIIDVYDVYTSDEGSIAFDDYECEVISSSSLIDRVIGNNYMDIAGNFTVRQSWEFIPPDMITFDKPIKGAIVVYNVPHDTLDTIAPDMYSLAFKPLCLGHVQKWLSAMRSKYESVATPFGDIKLNWQKLEQDAQTNIQIADQILSAIPLDHFVHVFV